MYKANLLTSQKHNQMYKYGYILRYACAFIKIIVIDYDKINSMNYIL